MDMPKKTVFDYIHRVGKFLSVVVFIALCVVVSVQVVSRYVFNYSFAWAEELPIFIFLWASFLAAATAYRDGAHLSVDFIADRFPTGLQRPLRLINLSLSLLFMVLLFYYEGYMTLSVRESTFVVLKISKAFCYMGIPVSCVIFALFIIEKLIRELKNPDPGRAPSGSEAD